MEPSARLVQPGEMWRHRAVGMAVMGSLGCPHGPLLPFPTLSSSSCTKRGLSRVSPAVEPQGWEAASQPGGTSCQDITPTSPPSPSAPISFCSPPDLCVQQDSGEQPERQKGEAQSKLQHPAGCECAGAAQLHGEHPEVFIFLCIFKHSSTYPSILPLHGRYLGGGPAGI